MSHAPTSQSNATAFREHAAQVAERLRTAISAVLNETPGLRGRRAVDLGEALRIDGALAWRIARTLKADDPFVASRHLPGAAGFRNFLRAAAAAGVSKAVTAGAQAAFDSFTDLTRTYAGNRRAVRMMLDAHAPQSAASVDLDHRRKAFEGNSYIWGVQARVNFKLNVLAPAADPQFMDLGSIRGFVDLRRIRPNVPWRITQTTTHDNTGNVRTESPRVPLGDPAATSEAAAYLGLIPEFCSRPVPECRAIDGPRGVRRFELAEAAVGNLGIMTCVFGEVIRCIEPRFRTDKLSEFAISNNLRTPVEFAIADLVLHRDLFGPGAALDFHVYSDLFGEQVAPTYLASDLLPVHETLKHLGRASEAPPAPEIPKHAEMLRLIFDRCQWNPADFDVYRVVMRYPPIPVNLRITRPLPDAPADLNERQAVRGEQP